MKPEIDYTLYLVTDRDLMRAASIEACVEQAILGGCTLVQLREKAASSRAFYETALRVRAVTRHLGVPLIINDRADIAVAVDADGVHVGQEDLPVEVVRRIVGPDRVVGVSAHTVEQAVAAVRGGADSLGVGAMVATATKADAGVTTLEELRRIRAAVDVPIVAIGGMNAQSIPLVRDTGIQGVAVVSAIVAQADVAGAARALKALFVKGRDGA